jgi:alpha-galactosidase
MNSFKTFELTLLLGASLIFSSHSLRAESFGEIANIATPIGVASQQVNNTEKTLTAPKPPMGWNSWDNFGLDITEDEFKSQVDYAASHLKQFGYTYMVIDAGWYAPHLSAQKGNPYYEGVLSRYATNVDAYGRWIPATNRFPSAADGSFRSLASYVHGKGLKFGLHIQRGIPWSAIEQNTPIKGTSLHARDIANPADGCQWWDATLGVDMSKKGAQEYYDSCYEQYASWGVDFVKVDDMSNPYRADEITAVRIAIEKTGRPTVFSLSPGSTPIQARYHAQNNADMWRISSDFWDTWPQLRKQFTLADIWMRFRSEGHWPDLDMLPVGMIGARSSDSGSRRHCRFTSDELHTMMTLWCMFRSPLILGGDLTALTDSEVELVTNQDLIDIDQNSSKCRQVFADDDSIVYAAEQPERNRKYVALFNVSDERRSITGWLEQMGMTGKFRVRDAWTSKDLGVCQTRLDAEINAHGAALFILEPL